MYIQILYLLKTAFLFKGIQQSTIRINYKPNKKRSEMLFLRIDILSKADILTKPTKNLVIIASSLWKKYLKKFIWEANIRSDIISLPPVCICSHFDGTPSPLSANLIIECSLMWRVRFSKYFCSILTNIIEYKAAHKSPVLTRIKELS